MGLNGGWAKQTRTKKKRKQKKFKKKLEKNKKTAILTKTSFLLVNNIKRHVYIYIQIGKYV